MQDQFYNFSDITSSALPATVPFEKTAMLARLKIGMIGATRKDEVVTKRVHLSEGTTDDAGYYSKKIFSKAYMDDIRKKVNEARTFHRKMTLPYDEADRLLPSKNYFDYIQRLQQFKNEFDQAVASFKAEYNNAINEARSRLQGMFDPNDYPDDYELDELFAFESEIKAIPQADHMKGINGLVSDEMQMLQDKINEKNKTAIDNAMKDLWHRLFTVVEKMYIRMTQVDSSKYHKSLIGNIEDLLSILPNLNFTNDKELDRMAQKIKDELCHFPVAQFKKDPVLRQQATDKAAEIIERMKAVMPMPTEQTNILEEEAADA